MPIYLKQAAIAALSVLTTLAPVTQAASTLPTGGTFVAGNGNISKSGNVLTINQNTLRGIIDWNTFSIGSDNSVTFNNGAGATLNRVSGATPTSILGQLTSTGNIYLLNPQGILIGHGATIHTGGDFLASTLNLPNSAFLNNALQFTGNSQATVVNLGNLTSTTGNIYLIGRTITNNGSITAASGTAGLAAGSQVLLTDSTNTQHVLVKAPGGDVTNSGFLTAAQVELKSNGGNIYALAGNNGGLINATGTATQDGHVWLIAANGTTNVSGQVTATNADGTGGNIETSGMHVALNAAAIKTGKNGNWLLDPDDLTIDSTLAATIDSTLNGGTNVTEQTGNGNSGNGDLTVASPIAWTTGANLTLSAFRNIALNAGISNTGSGNLTVRADNSSTGTGTISGSGVIDFSGSTGNVALLYNPSSYASPTSYSANFGSPNGSWTAPANGSVSSQYTAYMLVNSAANLQNLDANDAGVYALGQDIDLSSISNFTPLGNTSPYFTGILDGMGHTVSNLTITNPTTQRAGLFSQIANGGQVRNLNVANAVITIGSVPMDAGAIAGDDHGTVANSSSSGVIHTGAAGSAGGLIGDATSAPVANSSSVTIDGALCTNYCWLGGLVGEVETSIANSFATGSVTVAGSNALAGGLVGYGGGMGTITNSYATGAVSMSSGSGQIGGLVASNSTPINNSYATGAVSVTGSGNANPGGLVGLNMAPITNSHATGAVSFTSTAIGNAGVGGLVGDVYTGNGSSIANSYATGSVTATSANANVGGLAGYTDANVTNSYALGNVSATGNGVYVGGLVGFLDADASISVSYAMGNVTGGAFASAGGLIGYNTGISVNDTYAHGSVTAGQNSLVGGSIGDFEGDTVSNSYSTGYVSTTGAGSQVQGFMAYMDGIAVSNNYFDTQSSGTTSDGSGATGKTTAQLKSGVIPVGFNATPSDSPWVAPAGLYPYFGFQGPVTTVSGTAYSGSTVIPSAGVGVLSNGYLLGNLTTNGSGFYSVSEPQNMVQTGVLTYLTSNGTANTFSDGASPAGFTNMNLYVGTLNVLNSAYPSLSTLNTTLASTLGNQTGANFLYSINNGQLNPTTGTNVWITASTPFFQVDQPLTATGNVLINSAGNLTLAANSPVTSGSGDNITLVTGGVFANNAGSNALNTGEGGNWQVYSQNPANDTTGGLAEDYIQYNATYGETTPAQSGNGLLYTLAPFITASLTGDVSKTYDGATTAMLSPDNFTYSGSIQGDTVNLGAASAAYASANAGTEIGVTASGVSILSAWNGSIPVYGYQLASPTITANIGTILAAQPPPPGPVPMPTPAPGAPTTLTIDINNAISLTNQLPAFSATYAGPAINGLDIASLLAGLTYQISPAYSGPGLYQITATGVAPDGYVFNFVPGTFTVIGSSPGIVPTQATLFSPVLPALLPAAPMGLMPINALGVFQVNVITANNGFAPGFISFPGTPLAQSPFFKTEKTDTYVTGAKP